MLEAEEAAMVLRATMALMAVTVREGQEAQEEITITNSVPG